MDAMPREVETSSHWGTYLVDIDDDGRVIGTRPYSDDPDAAPAIGNVTDAQHARARVARPTLRRRWLENGPGPDDHRGRPGDEYVEVDPRARSARDVCGRRDALDADRQARRHRAPRGYHP